MNNPLSGKFNNNTIVESFEEMNYFTKITNPKANELENCYFKKLGLKNIVKLTNNYSFDSFPLYLHNMPNLEEATWGTMLLYYNRHSELTDTAYYLPKIKSIYWDFNWGGDGILRWAVIGTNNGGVVAKNTTNRAYYYMKKSPVAIFVPDELVDAYKNADIWSLSASRIHGISEFKTLVTDVTGEELPSEE